jgi:hypothetical protein
LTIAITIPATTQSTIAACVQIQNGDIASTIVRIAAVDRLETILDAVAARAQEAAQRLDGLTRRLDGEAPGPAPGDEVRVAAIELAVAGYDRAQAETRLRARFPHADLSAVLADVF